VVPFDPKVDEVIRIGETGYRVASIPNYPDQVLAQQGGLATVFRIERMGRSSNEVIAQNDAFALKVFKARFRSDKYVPQAEQLSPYGNIPGLSVCSRLVLDPLQSRDVVRAHPDLAYSVLMPWIEGAA